MLLRGVREIVWIIGFIIRGELIVVVVVVVVVTMTGLVIVRSARFTRRHCEVEIFRIPKKEVEIGRRLRQTVGKETLRQKSEIAAVEDEDEVRLEEVGDESRRRRAPPERDLIRSSSTPHGPCALLLFNLDIQCS